MRCIFLVLAGALLLSMGANCFAADQPPGDQFSGAVVLSEPGFPVADTAFPPATPMTELFPGARFAPVQKIPALLKDPSTRK
jgi:hypothetical protein